MKRSNGFLVAAAIILGLTALYWLYQVVGLIVNGADFGIYSVILVVAILIIVLLFVGRRRPLLGGILLASMSILLSVYYLMVKLNLYAAVPFLLFMCAPMALAGLLLIEADWSTRRKST